MSKKNTLFTIVSWNINSVRLRQEQVKALLEELKPDVLALQETKTPDEHFPFEFFKEAGYEYCFFKGMKSYNGVCFISKHPFVEREVYQRVGLDDCRHISVSVMVEGRNKPVHIHNLYIPAGGDEPDPSVNPKFDHKLKFLDEMSVFFSNNYDRQADDVVVLGDFNIAPYEHDVWSHKQLLKVVSHTPVEVERLNGMRDAFDWVDAARVFIDKEEKLYSWWSYRSRDWRKGNRGRRLDHIWVSSSLRQAMHSFDIMVDKRGIEKPSDHVPVVLTLSL